MQSLPDPFRPVTGPAGASPIAFTEPRGGGGQVTVLTRRGRLLPSGTHQLLSAPDSAALVLGTATATLDSIMVRIPGEHRIHDRPVAQAEIQLRFRATEGARVVLAIPVVSGSTNSALDDLAAGWLDLHQLLPHPRSLAGYHGTDTVPPFQTPAMWLVAMTPLTARSTQLATLIRAVPRPLPPRRTQPSRGRPVVKLHARVLQLRGSRDARDLTRT